MQSTSTGQPSSNPTTPRRASYLSPTKASLSRSHPNLLPQPDSAQDGDPRRRRSLRRVVAQNSAEPAEDVESTAQDPRDAQNATTQVEEPRNSNVVEPLEMQIASLFANAVGKETVQDVPMSQTGERSPPMRPPPRPSALTEPTVSSFVPKLVRPNTRGDRPRMDAQSPELDLPPTPVQLGLEKPPDRPAGLASSSSPGGSGRRRVRVRGDKNTSSPLKPRAAPPTQSYNKPAVGEIASGLFDSDHGSAMAEQPTRVGKDADEEIPEEIIEKQHKLKVLQDELKQLRDECSRIQALTAGVGNTSDDIPEAQLVELINLLESDQGDNSDTELVGITEHTAFHQDPAAWLNLFAPGNLQLMHQTWTKIESEGDGSKMYHQIAVKAPHPWPSNVMNLTFDLVIDISKAQIDNIQARGSTDYLSHRGRLHDWIQGRLQSPIYRYDLASIVNAAGEYFVQSVKRAKVLHDLSNNHPPFSTTRHANTDLSNHKSDTLGLDGAVNAPDILSLLPFLSSEAHTFTGPAKMDENAHPSQIMLLYIIDLSWTGRTSTNIDIALSGVSSSAAEEARKLFRRLQAQTGVVPAFQSIWELLRFNEHTNTQEALGDAPKPAKGKRRATRRFTEEL